jgi:uncharacterized protein YjbI with pentapeptide repeats
MEKIEIKSIRGNILFSHSCENNSMKLTVEAANTSCVSLSGADLRRADLRRADLRRADLRWAYLSRADIREAKLSDAYLSRANLSRADLSRADLREAKLSDADLRGVMYNETTAFFLPQCPSEGGFIAWKKAGDKIIKIKVTEDAKRSSATTLKCRCSKAEVLEIQNFDGSQSGLTEIPSDYDENFRYTVGEIVEVADFDENRWKECSSGIHFFINREMAVAYK